MMEYSSEAHTLVWLSVEETQKGVSQDLSAQPAFWDYVQWLSAELCLPYGGQYLSTPSSKELKIYFSNSLNAYQFAQEVFQSFSDAGNLVGSIAIQGRKVSNDKEETTERQGRQMLSLFPGSSLVYTEEIALTIEQDLGIQSSLLGLFSLGSSERPIPLYTPQMRGTEEKLHPLASGKRYKAPAWISNISAVLILLFSAFSWYALQQKGYFDTLENGRGNELRTIVIYPFENQTDIPVIGKLTTDWVINGFRESEIGRTYAERNLAELSAQKLIEAQEQLHTYFLIEGNIRQQDGRLHIDARIRNLLSKQILFETPTLEAHPEEVTDLVTKLQESLLEYWIDPQTVKIDTPPTLAAYQEFLMGRLHQEENISLAQSHFLKAFSSDSSFYPAIQAYAHCQLEGGAIEQVDAIIAWLRREQEKLNRSEKLQLQELIGLRFRDWEGLYQLWEGAYEKFWPPGFATQKKVELLLYQNKVQEAIDLLEQAQESEFPVKGLSPQQAERVFSQWSYGYYLLKKPESALLLKGKLPIFQTGEIMPTGEIFSLVQLRRWRSLDRIQQNLYEGEDPQLYGKFLKNAATACFVAGEDSLFQKFQLQMAPFFSQYSKALEQTSWLLSEAELELLTHNYPKALELLEQMESFSHSPIEYMRVLIMRGYIAGILGDEVKAKKCQIALNQREELSDWGYYGQAVIENALGNQGKAVAMLELALENGMKFLPETFTMDPLLRNLLDYEPYRQLVQPKS